MLDQIVNTPATMQGYTGEMSVTRSITQPIANICVTVQTLPVQCGANFTLR